MRKLSAAATLAIGLVFFLFVMSLVMACSGGKPTPAPSPAIEVEDCDVEDFVNREADCGFAQTAKPTAKPPTVKATKPTAGTRAPRR